VEILGSRIVSVGIAMGGHDQAPVGGQRVIDGAHRSGASDEECDDVAREDDDVLERQERMPVLEPLPRIHCAHASVLCMRKAPPRDESRQSCEPGPRGALAHSW
jgi:hypothetical protein